MGKSHLEEQSRRSRVNSSGDTVDGWRLESIPGPQRPWMSPGRKCLCPGFPPDHTSSVCSMLRLEQASQGFNREGVSLMVSEYSEKRNLRDWKA